MTSPFSRETLPEQWSLADGVTYLNHGSFGPSPRCVQEACSEWTRWLEANPMGFLLREFEPALEQSLGQLAAFVDAPRGHLVCVDNATFAMNIVAASVDLQPGDEVLLNNHEYGAVVRIWKRRCQQVGSRVVMADLPAATARASASPDAASASTTARCSAESADRDVLVNRLFDAITDRTRLIVVSHVTSPTAVELPVADICRRARERNISVCIDGPHAPALVDISLRRIDCDYYCASTHKWLSAPFGSGFLYVHPRQQKRLQPTIVSWGGSIGGQQPCWKDEFNWLGTRNPAPFLSIAAAIEFLKSPLTESSTATESDVTAPTVLDAFRNHAFQLTHEASCRLQEAFGCCELIVPGARRVPGMVCLQLPASTEPVAPGQRDPLQDRLHHEFGIEIPIIHWQGHRLLRVSAHLYNGRADIERLISSLDRLRLVD